MLGEAFADGGIQDHYTTRYADAHLQWLIGREKKLTDFRDNIESRAHGAFSIILMGFRVPEIGKDSVTHEFGYGATMPRYHGITGTLKPAHNTD